MPVARMTVRASNIRLIGKRNPEAVGNPRQPGDATFMKVRRHSCACAAIRASNSVPPISSGKAGHIVRERNARGAGRAIVDDQWIAPVSTEIERCRQSCRSRANNDAIAQFFFTPVGSPQVRHGGKKVARGMRGA